MKRHDLKKLALLGIALVASQGAVAEAAVLPQTDNVFLAHSCGASGCSGKRAPAKNDYISMSDDEMMMQNQGQMPGQPMQQMPRQGSCANRTNGYPVAPAAGSCANRTNGYTNGNPGASCASKPANGGGCASKPANGGSCAGKRSY